MGVQICFLGWLCLRGKSFPRQEGRRIQSGLRKAAESLASRKLSMLNKQYTGMIVRKVTERKVSGIFFRSLGFLISQVRMTEAPSSFVNETQSVNIAEVEQMPRSPKTLKNRNFLFSHLSGRKNASECHRSCNSSLWWSKALASLSPPHRAQKTWAFSLCSA